MTVFEPDTLTCQSLSDAASLRQLPKGRVMAPIDLGPAILAETNHDVFAAPYHRNNDGNLAMLKLMLAPPPVAHQMLSDRHVDYVAICRTAPIRNVIERAPAWRQNLIEAKRLNFLSRSTSARSQNFGMAPANVKPR